jgi:hypothetical protein
MSSLCMRPPKYFRRCLCFLSQCLRHRVDTTSSFVACLQQQLFMNATVTEATRGHRSLGQAPSALHMNDLCVGQARLWLPLLQSQLGRYASSFLASLLSLAVSLAVASMPTCQAWSFHIRFEPLCLVSWLVCSHPSCRSRVGIKFMPIHTALLVLSLIPSSVL